MSPIHTQPPSNPEHNTQLENFTDEDWEFESDDDEPSNKLLRCIQETRNAANACFEKNRKICKIVLLPVLICLYFAYFGYAMYYRFGDEGSIRLLWVTCVVAFAILFKRLLHYFGPGIKERSATYMETLAKYELLISW